MPYSVYEFAAMDGYFSQMHQKGWQYHWRFLCFIGFRKMPNAEALKCAPCSAEKTNSWLHLYKGDKIADDVRLIHKSEDSSSRERCDVLNTSLKGNTAAYLIMNTLLLLAACIFTVFVCTPDWDSMNTLWGMRQVASIVVLPCAVFLAVNQLFLAVRFAKICRFSRHGGSYLPWNNLVRYVSFFLAILLLLVQLVAGASVTKEVKRTNLYEKCRSAFSDSCESDPVTLKDSLTAAHYVLEPLSWEALFHVGEGTVRITYHECLSNQGAENYYAQFQKDNTGTELAASSDGNAQKLSAVSDHYYSIACVRLNRIVVVSFRNLSASESAQTADEIIDTFLNAGG